jgi:hypothetical protein
MRIRHPHRRHAHNRSEKADAGEFESQIERQDFFDGPRRYAILRHGRTGDSFIALMRQAQTALRTELKDFISLLRAKRIERRFT